MECKNNFRCSYAQFEDFTESMLWQDMLQEIDNWEQKILNELAAPTFDTSSGEMTFSLHERTLFDEMQRGHLRALAYARQLPYIIMNHIEQSNQETNDAYGN